MTLTGTRGDDAAAFTTPNTSKKRPSASLNSCTDSDEYFEPSVSLDEQTIEHQQTFQSQITLPSGKIITGAPFGQLHHGGCHLGYVSQQNGIPVLNEEGREWVAARTGEYTSFEEFQSFEAYQQKTSPVTCHTSVQNAFIDPYELPDKELVDRIIDDFTSSRIGELRQELQI
ncbi:hypothetical protein NW762_009027 [Fusarium torreyae]|uniref:Uncharacterized protein n=1 Tax=Fusarium torreyae TaxID=1237075 RepID=A0A9W8RY87_9HYPO|nr:hypothetical protein NW762_009027 [Fusarium torreyae]